MKSLTQHQYLIPISEPLEPVQTFLALGLPRRRGNDLEKKKSDKMLSLQSSCIQFVMYFYCLFCEREKIMGVLTIVGILWYFIFAWEYILYLSQLNKFKKCTYNHLKTILPTFRILIRAYRNYFHRGNIFFLFNVRLITSFQKLYLTLNLWTL